MSWYEFRPYVSVAQRQANARKYCEKLRKSGRTITPVEIGGRTIATTFWGKAWCEHLESYSDFANRLPRGRTYVRNGSVVDLQIGAGKISAIVSGSEIYDVSISIAKLQPKRWTCLKSNCGGRIGSVLELLQGRFDKAVMEQLINRETGMFPSPREIDMDCSCPDWAGMCKHIAAVLYGIGARLDLQPELLFTLRQVDPLELVEQAANLGQLAATASGEGKTIAEQDLADVFGIEVDTSKPAATPVKTATTPAKKPSAKTSAKTRKKAKSTTAKGGQKKTRKKTKPAPKPRDKNPPAPF